MKKIVAFFLVFLVFSFVVGPAFAEGHLSVLMYHRFDAGTSISISMKKFKKQIRYLKQNNYHFVSLDELIEHLEEDRPFPEKSVMITVDDGFRSTYTRAYPYLKEQEIPWVLYVYTEAIEKNYNSALTWPMIQEMAENGVDIQNHSYSHGKFIHEQLNNQWIEQEIHDPHRVLKEKTGQESQSFAIPYGLYDRNLLKILREQTDYKVVFDIDPGVVDPRRDELFLNRMGVNRNTSWDQFLDKLNRLPLAVTSTDPSPGTRLSSIPNTLTVTFENPQRVREGPLNVFVSEYDGPRDYQWSEDGQSIIINLPREADRNWNRLIVTSYDREKGKYRYYSQGLVFD